ncbi:MAG: ATP-dependent RecD-like DNA helicase [Candidatus Methylacidiphilales bacterium]
MPKPDPDDQLTPMHYSSHDEEEEASPFAAEDDDDGNSGGGMVREDHLAPKSAPRRGATSPPASASSSQHSRHGSAAPAAPFRLEAAPARPDESVAGLVERVTFHNDETGFAVLRVKVEGRRDVLTVIGTVPSVNEGEWIIAEGQWISDPEHGRQLKADVIRSTPPVSLEGIERYLGSGLIKGIGPVYAKKLVKHFGAGVLDIIEHSSVRLEEVEGIGSGRRRTIKDAWIKQKAIREIMVFLHSHGLSANRATRIYKLYGDEAIAKVRNNPYILARDVHGIGFKSADEVARKLGVPEDSLLRAEAGLMHCVWQAGTEGHCALPREVLLQQGFELLMIDGKIMDSAMERLISTRALVLEADHPQQLLYVPNMLRAEVAVADQLRARLKYGPPTYPAIDLPRALAWCEERSGKALAVHQKDAVALALRSRVLVITGGPGVGKTTLVQTILTLLRIKKVRIMLCAPTGRAAKRLTETTGMEAKTIHRLLEYKPQTGFSFGTDNKLLECDLLIVDESSMVDLPLMNALLRALPAQASLIMVGDVDQLPSVGPGRILADLIESKKIPVARLTEIFRQAAGSRIVSSAHAINEGKPPEPPMPGQESDFHFIERDEPPRTVATLLEVASKRLPAKLKVDPLMDVQILTPMHRGPLGAGSLNVELQRVLNPARPGEYTISRFGHEFRVRDKVIQTQNNYDKEVFNGDIGQVTAIDGENEVLTVRFDSRVVDYEFAELDEISHAFAITIHKAQGSEFPAVVVPIGMQHYMMLQRDLLYTGITRGKRMVVVIGQKKAFHMAIRNASTHLRYGMLKDRICNEAVIAGAAASAAG